MFCAQILAAMLAAPARSSIACAFAPAANTARRAGGHFGRGTRCGRQRPASSLSSLRSIAVVPLQHDAGNKDAKVLIGAQGAAQKMRVTSVAEFRKLVAEGGALNTLEVVGDTAIPATADAHPVLQVLAQRRLEGSKPKQRKDQFKVALAIEGGGMRGCVAAGMASALIDAGLGDCFDEIYGSSAGALVAAYWLPNSFGMVQYGCSIYYDLLTDKNSKNFIDKTRALTLLGYGFARYFTPRFFQEVFGSRQKDLPLLNLDYLLRTCVEDMRPLDWEGFAARESLIPLHIVASDVVSKQAVVLDRKGGHWSNIRQMTKCMRASMNLPAIAGPLVQLDSIEGALLADAQLYEPVPFKSALANGCTHVLVLRTRPDGIDCMPRPSKVEAGMMRNFFAEMPDVVDYLVGMKHKEIYCQDVLRLNAATQTPPAQGAQLLTIAPPEGVAEIGRLERRRGMIFDGVKEGYKTSVNLLKSQPGLWPESDTATTPEQATERAFPVDLLSQEPALSRSAWIDTYLERRAEFCEGGVGTAPFNTDSV